MGKNRPYITKKLSRLLEKKLIEKIYAREVTFNYGTKDVVRVDYMSFEPAGQMCISDIEKGVFTCYEVKSCKEDFHSGWGQNYIAEKNYLVMTMETYKDIINEIPQNVGVYIAIPDFGNTSIMPDRKVLVSEFENPTDFSDDNMEWKLACMTHCRTSTRTKSMNEMLFCMLRAKQRI